MKLYENLVINNKKLYIPTINCYYIPIVKYGNNNICGISEKNEYCVTNERNKTSIILDDLKKFSCLLALLEKNPIEIQNRLKNICENSASKMNWYDLIPIQECLEFLYTMHKSEYWINKSLDWVDILPEFEFRMLEPFLLSLSKNKNLSQQIRHSIKKKFQTYKKNFAEDAETWTLETPEE